MTYAEFVASYLKPLGSMSKVAVDLALLLDNEHLQVGSGVYGVLELRIQAFNWLSAAFVKAGLEPPPLEEALWRESLPKRDDSPHYKAHYEATVERAKGIKKQVSGMLRGERGGSATQARALIEVLQIFPDCDGFSGIDLVKIIAVLNRLLVDDLRLAPYRPDYARIEIPKTPDVWAPSKPVRVLIVDDGPKELFSSAIALIGISNVSVELFRYKDEGPSYPKPTDEEKRAILEKTAAALLEIEAEIILMDQGLGNIEGSELVRTILMIKSPDREIVFVANTGGDDRDLRSAGCYANFEKGRRFFGGLSSALGRFR
jgi:hypothetical protein